MCLSQPPYAHLAPALAGDVPSGVLGAPMVKVKKEKTVAARARATAAPGGPAVEGVIVAVAGPRGGVVGARLILARMQPTQTQKHGLTTQPRARMAPAWPRALRGAE